MADPGDPGVLLDYLARSRGFDLSAYKQPGFQRRVAKRLDAVSVASYAEYVDVLEVQPAEVELLFDTLLIGVTGFFRDAEAWRRLAGDVLPALLEAKPEDEPVRAWSAACATGEEAYSTAILLHRALGADAFRDRVKLYGTDLDEGALAVARKGAYSDRQVEGVTPEDLAEYFASSAGRHAVRSDIRRSVIFGRNDLIQDAPISRVDLIVCRNTLIYFNAETQNRILERLHFALREHGILFVGKSELLIRHSDRFQAVDLKQRIFRKRTRTSSSERYAFIAGGATETPPRPELPGSVRDSALDIGPVAQIAIDPAGTVLMINRRARALFGLRPADVGRPLRDLELSYRPADLRSPIEAAARERRPLRLERVTFRPPGGDERQLEIEIVPVVDGGELTGLSVTFTDTSESARLRTDFETSQVELAGLQQELQSTVEELETTNEELQSTNEELETTNEELQSTNEELETTNEELHSVNAELETTNDELRERGREVDQVNAFLEAILQSMGIAVVVVDRELRIQVWNDQAEELWGLRAGEVEGEELMRLDIAFPVERLAAPIRACLHEGADAPAPLELDTTNRRGNRVRVVIRCMPFSGHREHSGAVIMMEATPR